MARVEVIIGGTTNVVATTNIGGTEGRADEVSLLAMKKE